MYAPVWIEDLLFRTSAKTLDFYQCLSNTLSMWNSRPKRLS